MSRGLRRGLADLTCHVLQMALPPSLQPWGWAVRCETDEIADDSKALLFALDSWRGLLPRAAAAHLSYFRATRIKDGVLQTGGSIAMRIYAVTMRHPRALGAACAIGAVLLGLAYMIMAGAPPRYLAINAVALVIGLALAAVLGRAGAAGRPWTSAAIATMAGALLATALLGDKVEGATRWVQLGAMSVQPSLILLPWMLVIFSQTRDALATIGIITVVGAMALQPDRAMAGMLALELGVLTIIYADRHVIAAFVTSIVGLAVTLVRADTLPAVRYVDQIVYSSFEIHTVVGIAVLGGLALLLVPAIAGWGRDPTYAAFGAVWFAAIVAAALGNYPTPVVGYGGSAIIGYMLSLLALPKLTAARAKTVSQPRGQIDKPPVDGHMLIGMA
jgi:cell division protein FtsW (lipid II flippase)